MQAAIEVEGRNKVDALKVKKKLEQDINDLELALDALSKAKGDFERSNKKYQQQIRDLQHLIDEEHRLRHTAREELSASEKRAALLAGELEDMKSQIEILEKNRKVIEGELTEAVERISELTSTNSALNVGKKKLDSDIHTLKASTATCNVLFRGLLPSLSFCYLFVTIIGLAFLNFLFWSCGILKELSKIYKYFLGFLLTKRQ